MDVTYAPKEQERVVDARMNGVGKLMTDAHFDEALLITKIMEGDIQTNGRYADKLQDYSAAYARPKKNLSFIQAETIIRDLFEARTGMSMKEMLDQYRERETNLTEEQRRAAFPYANEIGAMIERGDISFHRASASQARSCAMELDITDAGAKRVMSEQFEAVNTQTLYDWGKAKEKQHYNPPQRETEKAAQRPQASRKIQQAMV